jgi:hypothetical protein
MVLYFIEWPAMDQQPKKVPRTLITEAANGAVDGSHSTASMCQGVVALKRATTREPSLSEVSTIGLDIAKSVFKVHGVDVDGVVVIRKRVSRAKVLEFFAGLPPCLIGIEALSERTSLGSPASGAWPHCKADASELREDLSQAQ